MLKDERSIAACKARKQQVVEIEEPKIYRMKTLLLRAIGKIQEIFTRIEILEFLSSAVVYKLDNAREGCQKKRRRPMTEQTSPPR